jgi:hypothetical protein
VAWPDDLIELASWALQSEDLRHRMVFSTGPSSLSSTPGIAWTLETAAVLAIYEGALRHGYRQDETIGYEWKYPKSARKKKARNPKRADLAFKERGRGKNWGYVEVKYYGAKGKSFVAADVEKLRTITNRVQRWMLVYRVRPATGTSHSLDDLLDDVGAIDVRTSHFPTLTEKREEGRCDIWLGRV